MSKVYVNQDALRIKLNCGVDISGALDEKIKYKKYGDDTIYEWTASIENAVNGIIYYDVQAGDLDVSGQWTVWSYITFADGRSAPGEAATFYVYNEGE